MNKQKGSPEILTQEKSIIYEQIIAHSVHKYDTLQKKKRMKKRCGLDCEHTPLSFIHYIVCPFIRASLHGGM